MLDQVKNVILRAGEDVDIESADGSVSISFFWSSPRINLGWYPIAQIDINDKMVFHHEGTENHEGWHLLVEDVVRFLEQNYAGWVGK